MAVIRGDYCSNRTQLTDRVGGVAVDKGRSGTREGDGKEEEQAFGDTSPQSGAPYEPQPEHHRLIAKQKTNSSAQRPANKRKFCLKEPIYCTRGSIVIPGAARRQYQESVMHSRTAIQAIEQEETNHQIMSCMGFCILDRQ